jgi:hypothetical protein
VRVGVGETSISQITAEIELKDSTIRVFAVANADNAYDLAGLPENYAVVADSQAECGWFNVLEHLDVSEARIREAIDGLPDTADTAFIERRQIYHGGLGPQDLLHFTC